MTPTESHLRAAMAEFNRIGSPEFLSKYAGGYSPKAHYVIIENIKYPLKALWRATLIAADANRRMQTSHARTALKNLGYTNFWSVGQEEPVEDTAGQVAEGARYLAEVTLLQRNRSIVIAAKKKWPAVCMVCDFDFYATYGDLGENYIECHHINPVAERGSEGDLTSVDELRLVCSNCHRMLHRRNPCLTVEELKEWIECAPFEPMGDFIIADDEMT